MVNSKILTKKVKTKGESIGKRNELVKLIDKDVNLIVLVDHKGSKAKQVETDYKYGLFSGTVIYSDTEHWDVGDYSPDFSKGRFKRIKNEIAISFGNKITKKEKKEEKDSFKDQMKSVPVAGSGKTFDLSNLPETNITDAWKDAIFNTPKAQGLIFKQLSPKVSFGITSGLINKIASNLGIDIHPNPIIPFADFHQRKKRLEKQGMRYFPSSKVFLNDYFSVKADVLSKISNDDFEAFVKKIIRTNQREEKLQQLGWIVNHTKGIAENSKWPESNIPKERIVDHDAEGWDKLIQSLPAGSLQAYDRSNDATDSHAYAVFAIENINKRNAERVKRLEADGWEMIQEGRNFPMFKKEGMPYIKLYDVNSWSDVDFENLMQGRVKPNSPTPFDNTVFPSFPKERENKQG